MGPLPYPHRATFLASTLVIAPEQEGLAPYIARLLSLIVFDHLVRHRIVTLGDHDDERLVDETGRLLDATHPQVEDSIDWFFRVSRRHEVLWFTLDFGRGGTSAPGGPVVLRSRRPGAAIESWAAPPATGLSKALAQCLAQWLSVRRLPAIAPLDEFAIDDIRSAAQRLGRADAHFAGGGTLATLSESLSTPPMRLEIPYLRVLAELARDEGRALDAKILASDPMHPVARRNRYVSGLLAGDGDRRAILPLVDEAPMYAKPHLSIWGEPFAADRPLEGMGVRHQGIAASLMPANPYACHNYSLQLAEAGRREESYRWADRATVAAPQFGAAHLDCVRRLRQVGRPGQAFAEAQYRCREILDRAAAGKLPQNDWQAPHHAALLIAFVHLDVGRLAEAIEIADEAMARLPSDATTTDAFAWAQRRIMHWKTDAGLLARAYAWEGFHRGDPGRVIAGFDRGRITDDEDAMMLIDSLVTLGREDQAEVAYWQCAGLDGIGVMGDGKARLAAAKALILAGQLDEALDQIQIVQLRRPQSRTEARVNRLFRLAATRSAADWTQVIERRLERGATSLAQRAARDLADFVPGLDAPVIIKALGERQRLVVDPLWIADLVAAVPAAQATSSAIINRLARPAQDTLAAADTLAQEWWTVLVPPARDRDAHAGGAVLAAGIALTSYLVAISGPPTPIAGAYRHIATEAIHLLRRSRYQIEQTAIVALLRLVDKMGKAPEWILDHWLLRLERALDLEAEHGAYLDGMIQGLPTVQRLLRGDERIGWELRMAHDLASDPSQYEPASTLFQRSARAVEGGSTYLAWSAAAAAAGAPETHIDVHALAAMANPSGAAAPWLHLARGHFAAGRLADGLNAAIRAMTVATAMERPVLVKQLEPAWTAAGLATPIEGNAAYTAGVAAADAGKLDEAVQHLRWAAASDPSNAKRAQNLAVALAKRGHGFEAVRVLAQHERADAPRLVGRVLADAGRDAEAVLFLRYAARRYKATEDWTALALAARRADIDGVAIEAGRKAVTLGSKDPILLAALARSLYRTGEFVECEAVAAQLIADADDRELRIAGLHAMARALAGQGRHVDSHPYARAAAELGPNGEIAAELIETMDRIVAQQDPPTRPNDERSQEKLAYAGLESGDFENLVSAITSPSWGIVRVALAASEFRSVDESGLPVASRALDSALAVLARTEGATNPDAVLARIRALEIRDNAFIQIDPSPPLGLRYSPEEFAKAYDERNRRPHRESAALSFAR